VSGSSTITYTFPVFEVFTSGGSFNGTRFTVNVGGAGMYYLSACITYSAVGLQKFGVQLNPSSFYKTTSTHQLIPNLLQELKHQL